jgi:hypothetical protein
MTPEQKKRRFRELARHDRICTGRELEQELQQPLLPFNECQENHAGAVPKGMIADRAQNAPESGVPAKLMATKSSIFG